MADPKDKSGTGDGGELPPPAPAVPAIPRLTPAVPEPVDPAQSAPRVPIAGAGPRPTDAGGRLPASPSLPNMPPAVAPLTPPGRPASRSPTGSLPAIPPVAPVTAPPTRATPTGAARALPSAPPPLPGAPRIAALTPEAPPPGGPATESVSAQASERAELDRRFASLDTLDYFQVMGLDTGASPADIKRAFHQESRTLHPDRFFQSKDTELRERVHAVYKRVTEAYFVLRDDVRRKQYLADVTGPERLRRLRFDETAEAEAKAAVKKEVAEQVGTHPKARQFFQVGVGDLEAGRFSSAEQNLKLALTYEPANALYKQKLEEAQAKVYEEYKRQGKGFRIE
jgi:hypothetical protein